MKKILIIEDDKSTRAGIIEALQVENYLCEETGDGQQGFEMALGGHYCLILLDLMLPSKNGIEICKQIRQELGNDAKVIAVTGYYSEENRKKILDAGADMFMKKPVSLEDLETAINKLIKEFGDRYYLQKKSEGVIDEKG